MLIWKLRLGVNRKFNFSTNGKRKRNIGVEEVGWITFNV